MNVRKIASLNEKLPALPGGFELAEDETLVVELRGAQLHLLKWMVGEYGFASLDDAVSDSVIQGYKYAKRLYEAEIVRASTKLAALAQATFDAWCARNPSKASDPRARLLAMETSGLTVDPILRAAIDTSAK